MIIVTESAAKQIVSVLNEEAEPNAVLRIFVQGGGCSGFQYGFSIEHTTDPEDQVISIPPFNLVVDPASLQYLQGSTIDFKKDLLSSSFVIKNPNSTGSCGCGSSFAA